MRKTVVALSLLALAGCDSGGVPLEDLAAEATDAICDVAESCYGRLADRVEGGATCRANVGGGFENGVLPRWLAAVDAGTMTYDPALGSACIAAQRELGCDVFISASPQACRDMFTGTIAEGDACSVSEECVGDAYCAGSACPDVPGTCTPRKASGEACTSADECQLGLACENGVCRAPQSASGGTCGGSTGLGCPIDELCVAEDGEPGTCTPLTTVFDGAIGEPCDLRAFDLCSPELSCVVTGVEGTTPVMECETIASSGGACNAGIPEVCPAGEYCDAQPLMGRFEGTCQPKPGEGEACAQTASGLACAQGLSCIGGTCARLEDNGGPCETGENCRSGYCDGGTCGTLPLCT